MSSLLAKLLRVLTLQNTYQILAEVKFVKPFPYAFYGKVEKSGCQFDKLTKLVDLSQCIFLDDGLGTSLKLPK